LSFVDYFAPFVEKTAMISSSSFIFAPSTKNKDGG